MPLPSKPSFLPPKPQVTPPSPDLKATSDYSMAGHRVTDWYDDTSTLPTPMRRIASTVNLVNVGASVVNVGVGMNGIKIGPGINPNISATNSLDMASTTINNPPIVNTGNNGPMCVQLGDWICSGCGFINWRRRPVCLRCFPNFEVNEHSRSIANGALLAAQLAAGTGSISQSASTVPLSQHSQGNPTSSTLPKSESTPTMVSTRPFSNLPPRPTLGTRSTNLYKAATTSNWYNDNRLTGGHNNNTIVSDDQLIRALQSQLTLSAPGTHQMPPLHATSNAMLSPSVHPAINTLSPEAITPSPSVPALSTTYNGAISPSIRDIWHYNPSLDNTTVPASSSSNGSSSLTAVPLSSSAITPPHLTPTYRPYEPTTIFGQDEKQKAANKNLSEASTPSTTPTSSPYNNDIWRVNKGAFTTSLSHLSGQASAKNSVTSSTNGDSASSHSSPKATSYFDLAKDQS